jgi:hypothetical protein
LGFYSDAHCQDDGFSEEKTPFTFQQKLNRDDRACDRFCATLIKYQKYKNILYVIYIRSISLMYFTKKKMILGREKPDTETPCTWDLPC